MRTALWGRVGVIVAATVAAIGVAEPAFAHVVVNAREPMAGIPARLTIRVPNEKAAAETVQLDVMLPVDTPMPLVSTKPMPGWRVTVERSRLDKPVSFHGSDVAEVVTKVSWVAEAGRGIRPGQFQEFDLLAGPLPDVDKIVLRTLQTYSDGEVVRWVDEPGSDNSPAAHPAPVLPIMRKAVAAPAVALPSQPHSTSLGARVLDLIGPVAGLSGLLLGLMAYRRAGRPRPVKVDGPGV